MRKFWLKLLVIALPVLLVLGYVENGLSHLDTHYRTKKIALERQADKIQILTLGSSNAYYGINPAYFSCTGFNLAFNAQSMYYDWQLTKEYVDRLPKLRVVVLPAIFFTVSSDLLGSSQDWRIFFYRQYFGLPLETKSGAWTDNIKRAVDARNFTKIGLYADTLYGHIKTGFSGHVDVVPADNGWFDSSGVGKADLKQDVGPKAAFAHSLLFDDRAAETNMSHWQNLVDLLKHKNIKVVVVHMPEDRSYFSNLDAVKLKKFTSYLQEFSRRNDIIFRDYSQDSRFALEDFTAMVDHMNPTGSEKFSRILNADFLQGSCK